MGSLMAGWDSHVHDAKSINLERNKSMTRDEIETYWRSKKNIDVVHDVLKPCHTFSKGDQKFETEKSYTRSNSFPITKESSILEDSENDDKEEFFKKRGWWINSRWAFLNEPPVIASETPSRYASQFHVATKHLGDSKNHAADYGIKT
ncbi:hypothetical protein CTI12_AA500230 [Artemisia annua]|uniref:Uncharacterized protein n=1 Tax=Artemisia annua TaxID=35608 RepID=A0A2U1LA25_ARTAN|nr:hypothetical protein CTI12_AA500230 [Artemisia annua]